MMTPSVFKRGLIWILFFIVSLVIIPFFTEEEPAPGTPPQVEQSSQVEQKK